MGMPGTCTGESLRGEMKLSAGGRGRGGEGGGRGRGRGERKKGRKEEIERRKGRER